MAEFSRGAVSCTVFYYYFAALQSGEKLTPDGCVKAVSACPSRSKQIVKPRESGSRDLATCEIP
jgi:hypothetical protein